jgi:hypothetical protein
LSLDTNATALFTQRKLADLGQAIESFRRIADGGGSAFNTQACLTAFSQKRNLIGAITNKTLLSINKFICIKPLFSGRFTKKAY